MLTPGQILLNEALPEDLRDYDRVLSAGAMEELLEKVAKQYPGKYKDVAHKLMQLGRNAVYDEAASVGLEDFGNPIEKDRTEIIEHVRKQNKRIREMDIPEAEKKALRGKIYDEARKTLTDMTYNKALESGNTFALQVLAKARGNPGNLASLLSTPGTYTDPEGEMIPFFVEHSHSEGLSPAEYFAASFGGRQGVTSTKFSTRDAGYLGKQFNQTAMRTTVTKDDCETANGIPVSLDDNDTIGSVLARPVGRHAPGTVLTKEVVSDLKQNGGFDKILARSPITCSMGQGICSQCAGVRESGKLPEVGEHVGINAASALAERIAQGSLNCLAENTLVRMGDGSAKPIQDIKEGEYVLGSDMKGNTRKTKVLATWDQGMQPTDRYYYRLSGSLTVSLACTAVHPILASTTSGPRVAPRKVLAGDMHETFNALIPTAALDLDDCTSRTECGNFILAEREERIPTGFSRCYDISVDNKDELFVLANGLVVKNTKHSSGQSKDGSDKVYAGFDVVNNLFQTPKVFPDAVALSKKDGQVKNIEEAPQGGWFVTVDDEKHYVNPGLVVTAKVGDRVEAGDQLSSGIANPREIVDYKGLGEGRRYFAERASRAFRDSGYQMHRRNMEVLTRALLDSAVVDDPDSGGEYLPGDVVSYSAFANRYKPREDSRLLGLDDARNKYLEEPVMHYTIGTRITDSVAKNLNEFGFQQVLANDKKPGFRPHMFGLRAVPQKEKDWMAQLSSSHLQKNILQNTHRGAESDFKGMHPVPAIAKAVGIGDAKAWKPEL